MLRAIRSIAIKDRGVGDRLSLAFWYIKYLITYYFVVELLHIKLHNERFGNFTLSFSDYQTFVGLFEEIFIFEVYAFSAQGGTPLILDCGSNIGLSVLYFKKYYPDAHIVCFEPQPTMAKYLEKNIAQNHLTSIDVHTVAISNSPGVISLFSNPLQAGKTGTSITQRLREKTDAPYEETVSSVVLSAFIQGPVDFLKMDIEGAEVLVLEELAVTGKLAMVNQMVVEYHDNLKTNPTNTLQTLLRILAENGFRYGIHSPTPPPWGQHYGRSYNLLVFAYKKDMKEFPL